MLLQGGFTSGSNYLGNTQLRLRETPARTRQKAKKARQAPGQNTAQTERPAGQRPACGQPAHRRCGGGAGSAVVGRSTRHLTLPAATAHALPAAIARPASSPKPADAAEPAPPVCGGLILGVPSRRQVAAGALALTATVFSVPATHWPATAAAPRRVGGCGLAGTDGSGPARRPPL